MPSQRMRLAVLCGIGGCAVAVAGCGGGGGSSHPLTIGQLPLVGGARVVAQVRQCDVGSNAYCAIQAVVVDPRASSSGALVDGERHRLRKLGWSGTAGDDGRERAAESPGRRIRVTYATALGDLLGWDLGWIKRQRSIAVALMHTMFKGTPAMSIMLEAGSA